MPSLIGYLSELFRPLQHSDLTHLQEAPEDCRLKSAVKMLLEYIAGSLRKEISHLVKRH